MVGKNAIKRKLYKYIIYGKPIMPIHKPIFLCLIKIHRYMS